MSRQYFTHATPTLYNAGTPNPQLSSCFLLTMKEDSIDGIYDTLKVTLKYPEIIEWNWMHTRALATYFPLILPSQLSICSNVPSFPSMRGVSDLHAITSEHPTHTFAVPTAHQTELFLCSDYSTTPRDMSIKEAEKGKVQDHINTPPPLCSPFSFHFLSISHLALDLHQFDPSFIICHCCLHCSAKTWSKLLRLLLPSFVHRLLSCLRLCLCLCLCLSPCQAPLRCTSSPGMRT